MSAHLDKLLRDIRLAASRGRPDDAKWASVYAGDELARLAEETGAPIVWPPELAAQPYRAWAEEGIERRRRRTAAPLATSVPVGWSPRPGATSASHSAGDDE